MGVEMDSVNIHALAKDNRLSDEDNRLSDEDFFARYGIPDAMSSTATSNGGRVNSALVGRSSIRYDWSRGEYVSEPR
jgi:hypothetical protein